MLFYCSGPCLPQYLSSHYDYVENKFGACLHISGSRGRGEYSTVQYSSSAKEDAERDCVTIDAQQKKPLGVADRLKPRSQRAGGGGRAANAHMGQVRIRCLPNSKMPGSVQDGVGNTGGDDGELDLTCKSQGLQPQAKRNRAGGLEMRGQLLSRRC